MKLSVIIPGYNTTQFEWERCIQCVKSAIDFAKCEAEIICVDDGSEDGATFLDCRDDIIVLHQVNQGPSVARNAGLAKASGDWVSFVDSDDVVMLEVYSLSLEKLKKENSDILVFGVETVWPSINLKKDDCIEGDNRGELSPTYLRLLQRSNLLNYVWNKIYKRQFLLSKKILFPIDAVMGEDLIFNIECAINGANWITLNYLGYIYYRTSSTLLSKYKPKYVSGLMHTAKVWCNYDVYARKFANEGFEKRPPLSEEQIDKMEWSNLWMPHSPYGFMDKMKWLQSHPHVGGAVLFVKTMLYSFLRRHLYFNFIRRWHIKRMYPYAKDMD